ncbi:Ribosomal protein L10e/L16 [Cynara cardunculus var. scolymus]|uniref:Ribosomal protein L10e/L16 n=2 Tax=Cynara cardunculus var. scolymus TaxID=59895 RepID=A0A103Y2E7_CYNCS|nr:Ribosomal protein L10e/L16 [Cynara cardunculus var. scolymus]
MAMAMAAKIARSFLTLRSSSSITKPSPLSFPSESSLSHSLSAANLNRSAGPYSPINSRFNSIPPLFRGLDVSFRFYSTAVQIQRMRFPKFRKGRIEGIRDGGNEICFGKYALQALEPARITSKQLEAGRRALQLNVRRGGKGGKVWVRIFPYKSVTAKPAEVRMGRGKGSISHWVAPVQSGQILYEMGGVTESLAKRAIQIAGSKLPIRTRSIIRDAKTREIGIR